MSLLGKSCASTKEYNPYTKRCNKKCTSGEERNINAKKKSFKCLKKCKTGTQRSATTNRCTNGKGAKKRIYQNKKSRSKSRTKRTRSSSLFFYDAKENLSKTKSPSRSQSLEYFYADKPESEYNYSNIMRIGK
jgi:hypothetical protein